MQLHPQQRQALDYLRRKGSEASAETVRRKVARTFVELDRRLATIDGARAKRRPETGGWSVHEIADHLVESHRPAVPELAALIAGRRPEGGPIPAGLQSAEPFSRGWGELCDELSRVHRSCLAALERGDDALPNVARAAVAMVVRCAIDGESRAVHWTEELDWKAYAMAVRAHVLEHLRQIERTLAAVTG